MPTSAYPSRSAQRKSKRIQLFSEERKPPSPIQSRGLRFLYTDAIREKKFVTLPSNNIHQRSCLCKNIPDNNNILTSVCYLFGVPPET